MYEYLKFISKIQIQIGLLLLQLKCIVNFRVSGEIFVYSKRIKKREEKANTVVYYLLVWTFFSLYCYSKNVFPFFFVQYRSVGGLLESIVNMEIHWMRFSIHFIFVRCSLYLLPLPATNRWLCYIVSPIPYQILFPFSIPVDLYFAARFSHNIEISAIASHGGSWPVLAFIAHMMHVLMKIVLATILLEPVQSRGAHHQLIRDHVIYRCGYIALYY